MQILLLLRSKTINKVFNVYAKVFLLLQVFNIAGHLIYWGDATVIFPLSETNMYAIAPNVPIERDTKYTIAFAEKFPDYNLLEVIIVL